MVSSRAFLVVLLPQILATDCSDLLIVAQGLKMDIIRPDIYSQVSIDCCSAQGVTCDSFPLVSGLDWSNLGLNGSIITSSLPTGILKINLSRNKITGAIPTDIPSATSLDLSHNKLSGTIPAMPTQVVTYDISDNVLTGPIPVSLPLGLSYYNVSNNRITGALPSFTSTSLITYDASVNLFNSGGIPSLPPNLQTLFIFNNSLVGSITFQTFLKRFDGSFNKFAGTMAQFPKDLLYFKANDNLLTGTLPTNLQLCTVLQNITLTNNKLSGPLPALLPPKLLYLNLDNNLFTGNVPVLPATLIHLKLGNPFSSGNRFTGSVTLVSPIYLFIPNNWITNVTVTDVSKLAPVNCDVSNNPLAGNPNLANLLGICLDNALFYASVMVSTTKPTTSITIPTTTTRNATTNPIITTTKATTTTVQSTTTTTTSAKATTSLTASSTVGTTAATTATVPTAATTATLPEPTTNAPTTEMPVQTTDAPQITINTSNTPNVIPNGGYGTTTTQLLDSSNTIEDPGTGGLIGFIGVLLLILILLILLMLLAYRWVLKKEKKLKAVREAQKY